MGNGVFMLWLEGIAPERLRALPAVQAIAAQGVDARLTPLPLAEPTNCYYQALTGMGSGALGRFDAVRPVAYEARKETDVPEGAWRRQLPDLLQAAGKTAALIETDVEHASDALEGAAVECVLLRVRNAGGATDDTLDNLIRRCGERAGTAGHTLILTDVWSPAPRWQVNVNTFLADRGLLETRPGSRSREGIIWSETLAYGLGTGQVWLNMRGRELDGAVEPGREYDDVRSTLIDLLRDDWRDPETDEPVVAQVLTKEEAYTGEHLFKAPDLVVVYRAGYVPSPRAFALDLDDASIQPGSQDADAPVSDPYALLIGSGPELEANAQATGRLTDVVPSMLYLFGLPIPRHLEGQVIAELFSPAYRERMPITQAGSDGTSLSQEEEGVIMGRLQALGYLG